jgi:hypothetical protein
MEKDMVQLDLVIEVPDGDYCENDEELCRFFNDYDCTLLGKYLADVEDGLPPKKECKHLYKKEIKEYDVTWERQVKKK